MKHIRLATTGMLLSVLMASQFMSAAEEPEKTYQNPDNDIEWVSFGDGNCRHGTLEVLGVEEESNETEGQEDNHEKGIVTAYAPGDDDPRFADLAKEREFGARFRRLEELDNKTPTSPMGLGYWTLGRH